MGKLRLTIILLCLLFWPLSLLLANTFSDFFNYLLPSLLVGISVFLLHKKRGFYLLPLLFIPFIEPKLAIFPFMVSLIIFLWKKEKLYLVFLAMSLLILAFTWRGFIGQTIFQSDYEAQQEIISKSYLYPNVATARIFQNKPRIFINKFNNNFFALVDPNNYFFNFHPREILIDNQNLNKYPFLSIVFAIFGFYYLVKHPRWKFILVLLGSMLFSLSILKIFDRNDFILWMPLSMVLIHGVTVFHSRQKKLRKPFYLFFLVFAVPELIRIFLR